MSEWTNAILKLLAHILALTANTVEFWAATATALVAMTVVLYKTAHALHSSVASYERAMIAVLTGTVAMLAAVAAAQMYLLPHVTDPVLYRGLPWVTAAIAMLLIAAPVACLAMRINYFAVMFAIALTLSAGIGTVYLTRAVSGAMRSGNVDVQRTIEHKQGLREVM